MNRNHRQNHQNGNNNLHNHPNHSDGITQSDAVSPRFRTLGGDLVTNYCYSCKSEFSARNIHDVMEHYAKPHESSLKCLYCKTGNVHQYKCELKGAVQFYHDCYRSKMGYDK